MSDLAGHERWVSEVFIEIAQVWVLKDFRLWVAEFNAKWHAGVKAAKYSSFRYVTWEEEQFLRDNKNGWDRVHEQAARFMKKEAFLWKQNYDQNQEIIKLRQELKFLKEM